MAKRKQFYHPNPVSQYAMPDITSKTGYSMVQKAYTGKDGSVNTLHPTKGWRRMAKNRCDNTYLHGYTLYSMLLGRVLGADFQVTP